MSTPITDALDRFINSQNNVGHFMREHSLGDVADLENTFNSPLQRTAAADLLSVLRYYGVQSPAGRGLRILDVGCCIGSFAFALAPLVDEVVGFDVEDEAIACALLWKEHAGYTNTQFFTLDAVASPQELDPFIGRFDAIVLKDVVEHVGTMAYVERMLRILRPLLAPGGVIYLETPNYLVPFEPHVLMVIPPLAPIPLVRWLTRLFGKATADNDLFFSTLHIFSPQALERTMRAIGFRVRNVVAEYKMPRILAASDGVRITRGWIAPLFRLMKKAGVARFFASAMVRLRLYPTLLYVLQDPSA